VRREVKQSCDCCYAVVVDTERIATLLEPYIGRGALSAAQLDYISTYVNVLTKWNARTNLTAIREEEDIVRRHFGESLFAAAALLDPGTSITAIDVGSGAGFPGLPMKIFAPGLHQTLVESHGKKATFLREVVRALHLKDVSVVEGRAEGLDITAELVTFRGVEKFEAILVAASKLVAPGGRLAALIGAAQVARAHELLPGEWLEPRTIPGSESRVLAIWRRTP
jgi:16S rRNA (guanine527-N7)-methyltransferase